MKNLKSWIRDWWIFVMLGIALGFIMVFAVWALLFSPDRVCYFNKDSFPCIQHRFEQCIETDVYTRDECVELTGK